jgi:nucleoside-diphosphate kinase
MGEIIKRIELVGLKFTAIKMVVPTRDQLIKHYNKDDGWFLEKGTRIADELKEQGYELTMEPIDYGKEIIELMVKYMTSAPNLAMIVEGNQAVAVVRKLVGSTEPATSDVGTIRGDYTIDSYSHASFENRGVRNLVHCSESVDEAEREIAIWFDESEIQDYVTAQERIMYDIDLDSKPE